MEYLLPHVLRDNVTTRVLQPPYDNEHLIQYADTNCTEGTFGAIMIQRVIGTGFNITQHIFNIRQSLVLDVTTDKPMITLGYFLKGSPPGTIKGLGKTVFEEGLCHLTYIPPGEHKAHLEPQEYAVLQVTVCPSHIRNLSFKYDYFREIWDSAEKSLACGIQQYAYRINARTREIIRHIFHTTLDNPERDIFLQARILDLLLLYVEDTSAGTKNFNTSYHFTDEDIRSLDRAFELHSSEPGEVINYKELARSVNLHPRKLLEGFALRFGIRLAELNMRKRIAYACKLLLETDMKIRDIGFAAGYEDISSFIRAFKRQIGCSPAQYRK